MAVIISEIERIVELVKMRSNVVFVWLIFAWRNEISMTNSSDVLSTTNYLYSSSDSSSYINERVKQYDNIWLYYF